MNGSPTSRMRLEEVRWQVLPALAIALLMLATPMALLTAAESTGPGTEVISGLVYDERGVPTEGVLVSVKGTSLGTPTDDDGRYTLTGNDLDGTGTLVFSKDGFMTAEVPYELEDGGTKGLSVYLVEVLAVPGVVKGRVASFTGEPLARALVVLDHPEAGSLLDLTDDHGLFHIPEVPASQDPYEMKVEAPGHLTRAFTVLVDPDSAQELNVTLAPETPMELIRGRVLDGRDLPLPGVRVSISGTQSEWTTDLWGRFSALLDGRSGTRSVRLSLQGYEDVLVPVEIPEPGLVEVDLAMTLSASGGRETLWALVVNEWTDEPVDGALVTIEGTEIHRTTDSAGVAILTGDDLEGEVTLAVTKDSHTRTTTTFDLEDGGTGVVTLRITRVSNAVTLEGTVSDGVGPVADASVLIDCGGIVWLTKTDAEGEFLVHNLPPGVPTLVLAIADGYEDARVETLLEEYALNHVSIVLEELRPVTLNVIGSVLSDDGPVQDARVTVWTEDGYMAVAISDERAEFTFELVAPTDGFVHFRAEHASYSTTTVDLQVPADGGQVPLEIRMEDLVHASVQVQGFVRDPDGFMVDGAQVTVGTMEESLTTETVDGHFSFVVYLPDNPSIQLTATADGYGLNSRSAIIADSGENWVNMTLPLGPDNGNILGSVRTDALRPLEGAEVQLTMAGTFMRTTLSAEDGSFHFRLVPASNQPYQLSVVAPGYDGATVEAMGEPGRTTWYNLVVVEDVTSVETIQGTVSSNEGLPVANAVVRIGGAWNVVTDSNGSYVLVDEDLEGRWSVAASLPGFENTYEIVEVAPGDTITVDLTLGVMGAQVTTVGGSVLKASNGQPLEGATVRLARSASGTWTFETTTGADGTFDFRGVPLAWDGVTVTVSYPGYIDHMARATLSETDATLFEFHMRKVVQPTVEEPVISESEAKQVGAGVTITFGALLVILMTEVGRVALLSLLLVPLYTKIKREKVMDHFVRGRIYEFVCQNPGVNYSAIKEQFKLTNGTVTYHLSMLERQEFIRAKQDGIYKRYFPNNGGPSPSDVEPMSLQLSIARAIRERPGMTQKEIAKRLKSSKQLVSYHIRRMKKDGQVETRRDGRSVRVYPNHLTPE